MEAKARTVFLFLSILFFLLSPRLRAEEINLKNGDKLTADKVDESGDVVKFHHPVLGNMTVPKDQVQSISKTAQPAKRETKKEKKKGDLILDRRLAAGYEAQRGNTDRDSLHGDFLYNRNRLWIDEWTLKGEGAQEYSEDKKITQRGSAMGRYAWSINPKLYHFYRIGLEHDRFEGIDARMTPTTGLGYWLKDLETLKLLGEGGGGYEYEFRHDAKNEGAPVLQFREMFSKKIGKTEFGEDVYYFPKLTDFGDYRIEGEAFLRFILTEHLAFKLKAGDQYRSVPVKNRKKNDLTFTSSVEWLF